MKSLWVVLALVATPALADGVKPDKGKDEPVRATAPRVGKPLTAEEDLLASELRAALGRLEARRLEIATREAALQALEAQVQAEMTELRKLQDSIGKKLDQKDDRTGEDRKARIAQLARMLKKMKPDEAGRILSVTSDDLAVPTLEALGERQAGLILGAISPARAVELTRKLVATPIAKGGTP